jgi:uncharacterized membrane protein
VTLVDIDLGDESGFDVVEQLHRTCTPSPSTLIFIAGVGASLGHQRQHLALNEYRQRICRLPG